MLDLFELATGTTPGMKHRRGLPARNQDSVLGHVTEHLISGVVADGSSSSPQSYVASALQVEWLTQLVHAHAATGKPFDEGVWNAIGNEIATRLLWIADKSHLPANQAIRNMWAATVGGVLIGPEFTHLIFFGDGRFYLNGELIVIEAAMEVRGQPAPAYPCYLVSESIIPIELIRFHVHTFPTAEVESAAALTDGLDDYLKAVGKKVPGFPDQLIPPPSYFWEADTLYAKPGAFDQWLNFIGRDWKKPGNPLAGGRLTDDLALAVARRKKTAEV